MARFKVYLVAPGTAEWESIRNLRLRNLALSKGLTLVECGALYGKQIERLVARYKKGQDISIVTLCPYAIQRLNNCIRRFHLGLEPSLDPRDVQVYVWSDEKLDFEEIPLAYDEDYGIHYIPYHPVFVKIRELHEETEELYDLLDRMGVKG